MPNQTKIPKKLQPHIPYPYGFRTPQYEQGREEIVTTIKATSYSSQFQSARLWDSQAGFLSSSECTSAHRAVKALVHKRSLWPSLTVCRAPSRSVTYPFLPAFLITATSQMLPSWAPLLSAGFQKACIGPAVSCHGLTRGDSPFLPLPPNLVDVSALILLNH